MNQEKPHLSPPEWLAVLTILTSLFLIGGISYLYNTPESREEILDRHGVKTPPNIEVTVEGEVEVPGVYSVQRGTTYEELWQKVKPLPNADLKKFKPQTKLRDRQTIRVPKATITIYLEGAVTKSGAFVVPEGSRLEDLIGMDVLTSEADLKKLQKRRKLKNQEIVRVSEIKSHQRSKSTQK